MNIYIYIYMPSLNKRRTSSKNKKRRRGGRVEVAAPVMSVESHRPELVKQQTVKSIPKSGASEVGAKTQSVNPFDNTMNEHLMLFGAFRDKIVEEKATDLSTLIDAFSNFVIEQIRSMPEEVKALAHMERHITEFENQNKEAATQLQTDHDATAKAMLRVEGKDDPYQPLIDYFVEVMNKDANEVNKTKVGGAKTKKARKKSKRRRRSKKRRRSGGVPGGAMVPRGPNGGTGWRWTFLALIMFIVIGWYSIFTIAQSSYENVTAAYADGIVARSGWMLYQLDRTWVRFFSQYVFFTGEEQLANAYHTLDTLMYSISSRLSFIDRNIHAFEMGNFINNAIRSTDINTIKFLFCDIVLYILTILTYIYYNARIMMASDQRMIQQLKTERQQITDKLIRIKFFILVCWAGFRHITEVTTTLASAPSVEDGWRLWREGGPRAFNDVPRWRELFTDRHGIGLLGYIAWNQQADLLAQGNGGTAPPALGDGSGGGGGGGNDDDGGGGPPVPANWNAMNQQEREAWYQHHYPMQGQEPLQ